MLVLRRRLGESITIEGGIEIEIVEISRTRVKLGVTAPRHVKVIRKETLALAVENRQAARFIAEGLDGIAEALCLLPARD